MATRKRISTVLGMEVDDYTDLAGKPLEIGAVLWRKNRSDEWQMLAITGETKGLWIVKDHFKVNKKTLLERDGRHKGEPMQWYTTPMKLDEEFRSRHRYQIAERVRWETDTKKLREIANLVGYNWNVVR